MSTKTHITCHCGQRVSHKDVLQKGQFLRLFSPSFIYVKYRCSRCKRLSERFVPQDQWDDELLEDGSHDEAPHERQRFSDLGGIGIDEVIDFHFRLENTPISEIFREPE